VEVDGLLLRANAEIDHLDEDREAHREVDVALGNVLAEPSPISETPMSSRSSAPASSSSDAARRSRDRLDADEHDADGDDHGRIMIDTASAMPTAVITESSEKTMSSSRIWTIVAANDAPRPS
jgi:hypothetical protein